MADVVVEDDGEPIGGADRQYVDSVESIMRNVLQKAKIELAAEVIDAGKFDMQASNDERRLTLEQMLNSLSRQLVPTRQVPTLKKLNRMIARSKEEVELFDKWDDELPWPGPLITADELARLLPFVTFTEADITEAVKAVAKVPRRAPKPKPAGEAEGTAPAAKPKPKPKAPKRAGPGRPKAQRDGEEGMGGFGFDLDETMEDVMDASNLADTVMANINKPQAEEERKAAKKKMKESAPRQEATRGSARATVAEQRAVLEAKMQAQEAKAKAREEAIREAQRVEEERAKKKEVRGGSRGGKERARGEGFHPWYSVTPKSIRTPASKKKSLRRTPRDARRCHVISDRAVL